MIMDFLSLAVFMAFQILKINNQSDYQKFNTLLLALAQPEFQEQQGAVFALTVKKFALQQIQWTCLQNPFEGPSVADQS